MATGAALGRDVDWVRKQRDVARTRIQAVRDRFLSIFSGIGALHATKEDDPPPQPQEELAVSVCFSAPVDYLSFDIPCRVGNLPVSRGLPIARRYWIGCEHFDGRLRTSFRLASGLRVPVANVAP